MIGVCCMTIKKKQTKTPPKKTQHQRSNISRQVGTPSLDLSNLNRKVNTDSFKET